MSYVNKVLQPGEIVLSQTRLHWFIYLRSIVVLLLAIAVLIGSIFVMPETQSYVQIAAAILAFIGLWLFMAAWIRRSSTELAVTNRRVIHKTGFFGRTTQEMNREKIESVDVQQTLAGRMFGYGSILVRGVGSTWEPYKFIAHPLSFRSSITAPAEPLQLG